MPTLPISAIIATRHRAQYCAGILDSIAQQDVQLAEVIVCDASEDDQTRQCLPESVVYLRAEQPGAAPQRNQAIRAATQPFILLMDDDITLEPGCLNALWQVMQSHPEAGAITATITNEAYTPPGKWTLRLLRWLDDGRERPTYAGACVGPGYTFWPANDPSLPAAVAVEWMGAGCALYRREQLPDPPFAAVFHGASLGEDLALSLQVAKRASLLQATHACFVHLSAGGDHKSNARHMARMNLINRHYIMTQVMEKRALRDHVQLAVMLLFGLLGSIRQSGTKQALVSLAGYFQGVWQLLFRARPCAS